MMAFHHHSQFKNIIFSSWDPLAASNLRCAVIITWIIWLTLVIYKCICMLNKGYKCTFDYIQSTKLLMLKTALSSVLYTDCTGVRNINTFLINHRGQCSLLMTALPETLFHFSFHLNKTVGAVGFDGIIS